MKTRLQLRAEDAEDIAVISACLQDGLITFADMEYLVDEQRFVLVVNRFCWECGAAADGPAKDAFMRVNSGLCFDTVTDVHLRNLDRKDRSRVLELLAVTAEDGHIDLLFAERGRVRLEVTRVSCHMQDLDEPWPTRRRPRHRVAEAS